MKKLIILLILVLAIPVIAQESKADKVEKPRFEVKKYEILKSQKSGLVDLLARHQRELSDRLTEILADLKIIYPDMPEDVVFNQRTLAFEAKVSIKEKIEE